MKTDILIIGSGAGGAALAKELSGKGKNITIIEKGEYILQEDLGTSKLFTNFYVGWKEQKGFWKSKDRGIQVGRTINAGGTAVVAAGNGSRCLEKELLSLGIDLTKEFKETENELKITPVPENHMGEKTKRIVKASGELGYDMHPMPKFIDFTKCINCGLCMWGCRHGAKWSPVEYLREAESQGVNVLTNITIEEVMHSNGKVTGVKGIGLEGNVEISADIVVLAAGGLETPRILLKSGISNAGKALFIDMTTIIYGFSSPESILKKTELITAAVITDLLDSNGFILAPNLTAWEIINYWQTFQKGKGPNLEQALSVMLKIKDDNTGKVNIDGSFEKDITESDQKKLKDGTSIAKDILIQAGCDPNTVFTAGLEGGHPGGTAAIGEVVNTDLETEINNLFVSDASVLPTSPGAPPITTIISLAKRLANKLINEYFK